MSNNGFKLIKKNKQQIPSKSPCNYQNMKINGSNFQCCQDQFKNCSIGFNNDSNQVVPIQLRSKSQPNNLDLFKKYYEKPPIRSEDINYKNNTFQNSNIQINIKQNQQSYETSSGDIEIHQNFSKNQQKFNSRDQNIVQVNIQRNINITKINSNLDSQLNRINRQQPISYSYLGNQEYIIQQNNQNQQFYQINSSQDKKQNQQEKVQVNQQIYPNKYQQQLLKHLNTDLYSTDCSQTDQKQQFQENSNNQVYDITQSITKSIQNECCRCRQGVLQAVIQLDCFHFYHPECFKELITNQIKASTYRPVKCLCNKKISVSQIKNVLKLDITSNLINQIINLEISIIFKMYQKIENFKKCQKCNFFWKQDNSKIDSNFYYCEICQRKMYN